MKTLSKEQQKRITPEMAVDLLLKGNERFINNLRINRNLLQQVDETSDSQHPFAVIISCMDSRTSPELIFDQGLGDIFSIRVAGNIVNEEILGSAEYGCKVVGSKVILVLGHTQCGAVKGAIADFELGHLHFVTSKIQRSVTDIRMRKLHLNENDFCVQVTRENVLKSIKDIKDSSPILAEMENKNEIQIVGGLYDVSTGVVEFFKGADKSDSDFRSERNLSSEKRSVMVDIGV